MCSVVILCVRMSICPRRPTARFSLSLSHASDKISFVVHLKPAEQVGLPSPEPILIWSDFETKGWISPLEKVAKSS